MNSSIKLTKQAIAVRLIRSAVISYLRDDDKLAVFLLARSAMRILHDLSEHRDADSIELNLKRGFFYWAKELSENQFQGPDEIRENLEPLALNIVKGRLSKPEEIDLKGYTDTQKKEVLSRINKEYNFIKHADRDPIASINEGDVDHVLALQMACQSLFDLFPNVEFFEAYLFKYLMQRKNGKGYSADVDPFPANFDEIPDEELHEALLSLF